MYTSEARELGHNDAVDHIHELRTSDLSERQIATNLLKIDFPDEALVNALTKAQLTKLMGFEPYDREGDLTTFAMAWLNAYNEGYKAVVRAWLANYEGAP